MSRQFYGLEAKIVGAGSNQGKQSRLRGNLRDSDIAKDQIKKANYGLPKNKNSERYKIIKSIDPNSAISLAPVVKPLTLSLILVGNDRETFRTDLENWGLQNEYHVPRVYENLPLVEVSFKHIGAWAACLKLAGKFISPADPIFEFRNEKIFLAKTVMSEHTTYVHTSSGPEQIVRRQLSYNRALNIKDALIKVRDHNLARTMYYFEKFKGSPNINEPNDPRLSEAFDIRRNFSGTPQMLTEWLMAVTSGCTFNQKNKINFEKREYDREKLDKNKIELNVAEVLGHSNIADLSQDSADLNSTLRAMSRIGTGDRIGLLGSTINTNEEESVYVRDEIPETPETGDHGESSQAPVNQIAIIPAVVTVERVEPSAEPEKIILPRTQSTPDKSTDEGKNDVTMKSLKPEIEEFSVERVQEIETFDVSRQPNSDEENEGLNNILGVKGSNSIAGFVRTRTDSEKSTISVKSFRSVDMKKILDWSPKKFGKGKKKQEKPAKKVEPGKNQVTSEKPGKTANPETGTDHSVASTSKPEISPAAGEVVELPAQEPENKLIEDLNSALSIQPANTPKRPRVSEEESDEQEDGKVSLRKKVKAKKISQIPKPKFLKTEDNAKSSEEIAESLEFYRNQKKEINERIIMSIEKRRKKQWDKEIEAEEKQEVSLIELNVEHDSHI